MSPVSVRQLTKTYGEGDLAVAAVRYVDLDIAAGEVVLIMGPSGSGKTTLLLMLGAMLRPTSGSITIDGVDLATAAERDLPPLRARHFGFIFQDFNLLSALDVVENVELACNVAGVTWRAARERATALLRRLGAPAIDVLTQIAAVRGALDAVAAAVAERELSGWARSDDEAAAITALISRLVRW